MMVPDNWADAVGLKLSPLPACEVIAPDTWVEQDQRILRDAIYSLKVR